MFFGISHLIVPVTALDASAALWGDVMGFTAVQRGDGFVDMDTGSATLRLLQVQKVESSVSLRLQVSDVTAAYGALLAAGAASRYDPLESLVKELSRELSDDRESEK